MTLPKRNSLDTSEITSITHKPLFADGEAIEDIVQRLLQKDYSLFRVTFKVVICGCVGVRPYLKFVRKTIPCSVLAVHNWAGFGCVEPLSSS